MTTHAYATLVEAKLSLGIPASDTEDNPLLELALEAASRAIDTFCHRRFWDDGDPVVRYFEPASAMVVNVPDGISTATGLVVRTDENLDGTYETTWMLGTDFQLEPLNAEADGRPWTRIRAIGGRHFTTLFPWWLYQGDPDLGGSFWGDLFFMTNRRTPVVQITARGSWAEIPAVVRQACLIQTVRLFKRKDAPFGVAGTPEFGSELRLLSALDPDVQALLRGVRRIWAAV